MVSLNRGIASYLDYARQKGFLTNYQDKKPGLSKLIANREINSRKSQQNSAQQIFACRIQRNIKTNTFTCFSTDFVQQDRIAISGAYLATATSTIIKIQDLTLHRPISWQRTIISNKESNFEPIIGVNKLHLTDNFLIYSKTILLETAELGESGQMTMEILAKFAKFGTIKNVGVSHISNSNGSSVMVAARLEVRIFNLQTNKDIELDNSSSPVNWITRELKKIMIINQRIFHHSSNDLLSDSTSKKQSDMYEWDINGKFVQILPNMGSKTIAHNNRYIVCSDYDKGRITLDLYNMSRGPNHKKLIVYDTQNGTRHDIKLPIQNEVLTCCSLNEDILICGLQKFVANNGFTYHSSSQSSHELSSSPDGYIINLQDPIHSLRPYQIQYGPNIEHYLSPFPHLQQTIIQVSQVALSKNWLYAGYCYGQRYFVTANDLEQNRHLTVGEHPDPVTSIKIEGLLLVTACVNKLKIWDRQSLKLLYEVDASDHPLIFPHERRSSPFSSTDPRFSLKNGIVSIIFPDRIEQIDYATDKDSQR